MYHSSRIGRMFSVARLAFGARGYSLRILVVDDHETVRRGVCSILESRKDVEICGEAAKGQDAIEKASQLTPDLIILDVTMPELDGFAAARQIRTFQPEVPIIMLSMHDGQQIAREAQRVGAQGFVSKSAAGHVLLKAVDIVLQGQNFFPTLNT
jgi:two-component system, NarL family, response regulator NreC